MVFPDEIKATTGSILEFESKFESGMQLSNFKGQKSNSMFSR